MRKHLLGIDIGSGSCKVCLIDEDGGFVGSASKEYAPLCLQPGWFEQDPMEWFHALIQCLHTLVRETGIDLHGICAVAATGQMKGATFIGHSGQIVRRTILWNDLRNTAEVEELKTDPGICCPRFPSTPSIRRALSLSLCGSRGTNRAAGRRRQRSFFRRISSPTS